VPIPSTIANIIIVLLTQALEGLEYIIMMLGHRFSPFVIHRRCNMSKSNFWEQKSKICCICYRIIFNDKIKHLRCRSRGLLIFVGLQYFFGIEILGQTIFYAYARLSGDHIKIWKLSTGRRNILSFAKNQQCQNSIVVCNLQITNKLETFYVNRGNQEGDSKQKYLLNIFLYMGSKHIWAKVEIKTDER
jgi:hypothetical protein